MLSSTLKSSATKENDVDRLSAAPNDLFLKHVSSIIAALISEKASVWLHSFAAAAAAVERLSVLSVRRPLIEGKDEAREGDKEEDKADEDDEGDEVVEGKERENREAGKEVGEGGGREAMEVNARRIWDDASCVSPAAPVSTANGKTLPYTSSINDTSS